MEVKENHQMIITKKEYDYLIKLKNELEKGNCVAKYFHCTNSDEYEVVFISKDEALKRITNEYNSYMDEMKHTLNFFRNIKEIPQPKKKRFLFF